MQYFLFILYLLIFAWLVTRIGLFRNTGLSRPQLVSIFLLKIMAGIFYGWIGHYHTTTAQIVDTWSYHERALVEYGILRTNPSEYFTNLFHNPYPNGLWNFFGSTDSYWNDLKANVFIKLLSVFDIFSFGNYYTNVIFYAFLSFFGNCLLYRVFRDRFPEKATLLIFTVFFVPSFFYWANGIHKEGLIFTGMALILYHLYFAEKHGRYTIKNWLGIGAGLLILLLLRNFILVVILPAMSGWFLAARFPRRKLLCYTGVFAFFILVFFTLPYIHPRLDFPGAVVEKQRAFVNLIGANSAVPIAPLEPGFLGFLKNTPQAISLALLRPYPADIHHLLSLAAALENFLLILLLMAVIFVRDRQADRKTNLVYFCVFFSAWMLLAIGFSVNNLGAISRYRSIVFPFLISAVCIYIDWNKLARPFTLIKKKNNIN